MGIDKILSELEEGLTGNIQNDMNFLREQGVKYRDHEASKEINMAIGELSLRVLSNKKKISKAELEKRKNIINTNYYKAEQFAKVGMYKESKRLLEEAIRYIPYKENAGKYIFSFASAVEIWIYSMYFKPNFEITQSDSDNSSIYRLLGYVNIRLNNYNEALKALQSSLIWNPVSIYTIVEIAEINRRNWRYEDCYNLLVNALNFAKTNQELAVCYFNLAHYYSDIKDYETSVILYQVSDSLCKNKQIDNELSNLKVKFGVNIEKRSNGEIIEYLKMKKIQLGASDLVIEALRSLGGQAKKNNSLTVYKYCKELYAELTGKELI